LDELRLSRLNEFLENLENMAERDEQAQSLFQSPEKGVSPSG
jgi:hypothetical protein